MKAQEFAKKLGIELELTREKDNASLVTRVEVGKPTRYIMRVPRSWDLDTEDHQRVIWHEIGHFVDQATHRGGHSQLTARLSYGRFSTENWRLLQENQKYLQAERRAPEIDIVIHYKRKKYESLEALEKDPEVPQSIKNQFRVSVSLKRAKWKALARDYMDQETEIFADGFAKYMMDKDRMLDEHQDLALLFEIASRNPSKEELETRKVEPKSEWLVPIKPKHSLSGMLKESRKRARETMKQRKSAPSGMRGIR